MTATTSTRAAARCPRCLLTALSALLLTACAAPGGAGSGSDRHVELRLGFTANITQATALVGIRRGLLAEALGPRVTLRTATFNAGPDLVEALFSSSIDAAYLGPNPAINAFVRSHGRAIRVISGAASGGTGLVVRTAIASPADLRGRTVATPQLGSTQDVALRWWLAEKGFRTTREGGGDVHVHPQDNAQTLTAFRSGQIDGAWVPEPWAARLVLEGGGRTLVDERDLWPGGSFATAVLVVRADFLRQHPSVVRRLLDGQIAADDFVNRQPARARELTDDAIGAITGRRLAEAVVADAWAHITFTDDPIASSLRVAADHAQRVGLLDRADLAGLVDLTLLNEELEARGRPAVIGS